MSDAPQDPGTGEQDGGYGYPTLEQEVTPEVLAGGAGSEGSDDAPDDDAESTEDGGAPVPGELVEDPSAVEPTD